MPKYPYRIFGSWFDRTFRNALNDNFVDVETDLKDQKTRVDNLIQNTSQPEEVVDLRLDDDGVLHPTASERVSSDVGKLEAKDTELDTKIDQNYNEVTGELAQKPQVDYSFLNMLETGQISKIKLVGDSITVGIGAVDAGEDTSREEIGTTGHYEANIESRCWANYFREYIADKYPTVDFFNAGIGGWSTSSEGLTYGTDWYGTNNDTVIVMLGANDRQDATSESDFSTNIETVIKDIELNSNNIIVMTSQPTENDFNADGTRNTTNNLTMDQIDKVIGRVCVKNGWKHVSFYRDVLDYQMHNQYKISEIVGGSHPNMWGHKLMWKVLQQNLNLISNTYEWENNVVILDQMKSLNKSGAGIGAFEPLESFRDNTTSFHVIFPSNSTDFPEESAGVLQTNRLYSDSYSHQIYVTKDSNRTYKRYWEGTGWSKWYDTRNISSLSGSTINSTDPITDFPSEQIRYYAISSGHTDRFGYPFGSGGVLKVVRTYNDNYSYQEFIGSGTGWGGKRYWNGTNWTKWVSESQPFGTTAERPFEPLKGMIYFDTDLSKPIWCKTETARDTDGTKLADAVWVDATGTTV